MTDNVTLPTSGTGSVAPVIATDDVAGVQFQKVKLDGGGDGLSVPVVAGQQVMASSLPVTLASNQSALPITDNSGSVTVDAPVGTPVFVKLSDGAASLVGQKTMALSVPVVLASDQTVIPVSDNAGSLTVDAPVGTPVFSRLSDGAAALIGQKAMTASLPVVLASDQTVIPVNGDVDHDAVNTLKNIQVAGNASPTDVPPTAVSANGDRSRMWVTRSGAQVVRPQRVRESYTAVFRLGEAAARLDQTFTQVANTTKQWATLHHTAVASTKETRLLKCVVYITAWSVATQGVLELRQLSATTAPATGNPAITPTAHRRGGTAAECVCLYLPTTQGTEAAVDKPLASIPIDYGIMGAVSTINPLPYPTGIVLYDAADEDPEMNPPTLPVGTLDGWGVVLRTVSNPAVRMTVVMRFSEETP